MFFDNVIVAILNDIYTSQVLVSFSEVFDSLPTTNSKYNSDFVTHGFTDCRADRLVCIFEPSCSEFIA